MGETPLDRAPLIGDEIERQQIVEFEKARAQPIVDIVIVIGDVVRHRRHLRFERGPGAQHQRKGIVELGQRPVGRDNRAVVLGQAFEQIPGEIEAIMRRIGALDPHHRAQRLRVVAKAAMAHHRLGQRCLPGMAEGRVAEIMGEAQGLGQILVQAQRAGDHPPDLRNFEAVGEAGAIVIAERGDEHLRLGFQPPEAHRMDDPVTIALEGGAGSALFARCARRHITAPFAPAMGLRIGSIGGAKGHGEAL